MDTATWAIVISAIVNVIAATVQVNTFLAWRSERQRPPHKDAR